MDNEDSELIKVVKPKKQSLLEKYDILVDHLSFEYISQCTNTKELERIVIILRSGDEGVYPDLTKHAEDRLTVLKPSSSLLRKTEPVLKRDMLEPNEREQLESDISDWMREMKNREKDLSEGKASLTNELFAHPDIRQVEQRNSKKKASTSETATTAKRIPSCDYAAWDKFDADTELNRIDLQDERRQIVAKETQRRQREAANRGREVPKEVIVNELSLTGTEIDVMALQEREKGNEAFRAGDYEEALQRYNASINIDSNPITYNNRAMTLIKLCRFEDAIKDCNTVISLDYKNVKALLRRAYALERLEKKFEAFADYESVIKLEPNNTIADAALFRLRRYCQCRKMYSRMKITEEPIDEHKDNVNTMSNSNKETINSVKKTPKSENTGMSLCFCDRAPGASKNSKPLPHIKSDYCLGFESVRESPRISKSNEPSKSTFNMQFKGNDADSRLPKPKSIFSYVSKPNKPSNVIIEEIPNDTCDNKNISKSTTIDKEAEEIKSKATHIEKVDQRCQKGDNKRNDLENSINHGDTERNNAMLKSESSVSSQKIEELPSKEDNQTNQSEKESVEISENFGNIQSPYEYFRLWQSGKCNSDLKQHERLLRSIAPSDLNMYIGNKLDSPMLSLILRCLKEHFCTTDDVGLLSHFLRSITTINRFEIISLCFDEADKKVLEVMLQFLEDNIDDSVDFLREKYYVKK